MSENKFLTSDIILWKYITSLPEMEGSPLQIDTQTENQSVLYIFLV